MADIGSIGIVGGGASGITCAAALNVGGLRDELSITIFEGLDQVLPLQSGALDKFLAPHLIDWPDKTSLNPRAELPLLGWRKGVAGNVAADLVKQFNRFGITVNTGAKVVEVRAEGSSVAVTVGEGADAEKRWFDLVILAAGFGLEAETPGIEKPRSYWRVHPQQGPALQGDAPKSVLISGLGDGGLIDFVLFALPGVSHEAVCQHISTSSDVEKLLEAIEELEEKIWQVPSPVADIAQAYAALNVDNLARAFGASLIRGVSFTLLTREAQLFHKGTAPLNRLAATAVMRAMELDKARGTSFQTILLADHISDTDAGSVYVVGGDEKTEKFGIVVTRHGDTSVQTWKFNNPDIDGKVAGLRNMRRAITARPRTPLLSPFVVASVEARMFAKLPTRIRLSRNGNQITWKSDLHLDEIGRLWRAPSAPIQIEIAFPPSADESRLDLAVCRLLVHAEPKADLAGMHADAWINLMDRVPVLAGDRTRAATKRAGVVTPDRVEQTDEEDVFASKLESALDAGLLLLLDDRMREIGEQPARCPIHLHVDIREQVLAGWRRWHQDVSMLTSDQRRWVLSLFGGLLDGFGQPDRWSSVRIGPRCLDDELLPAVIFHLAMQALLPGFSVPAKRPNGNVLHTRTAGVVHNAAHFCGTRFFRNVTGEAKSIGAWEKRWPGDQFVPSCLVLPGREAECLPDRSFIDEQSSSRMMAPPGGRTPVIVGSQSLKQALATGAIEATSEFEKALHEALPEVD